MSTAEMFLRGFSRICSFYLLAVLVWTTKVHSPIYSNQKDVHAVKQLASRGQLSCAVKFAIIWMLPCLKEEILLMKKSC